MENAKTGKTAAESIELTYYVAECMEFLRYGEYVEGIPTLEEALERYGKIPSERLEAGKGIGIQVHDKKDVQGIYEYPLLLENRLDINLLKMLEASCIL